LGGEGKSGTFILFFILNFFYLVCLSIFLFCLSELVFIIFLVGLFFIIIAWKLDWASRTESASIFVG